MQHSPAGEGKGWIHIISVGALVGTTLLYDVTVKRTSVTRFLFWMRLRPKTRQVTQVS